MDNGSHGVQDYCKPAQETILIESIMFLEDNIPFVIAAFVRLNVHGFSPDIDGQNNLFQFITAHLTENNIIDYL